MSEPDVMAIVKRVLDRQASALHTLSQNLAAAEINSVVQQLLRCPGRVVLTGMGKMGAVARKAAATFSSTGTPALFVHPSEALHGDLGMITPQDLFLALSYSGETDEVLRVVETIQPWQIPTVAMTGNANSMLAKLANTVLLVNVACESSDFVAVPSCSTTAALALCDALAIAAMESRGFSAEDFGLFHPGGTLGRKLRTTVANIMHSGDKIPKVDLSSSLRQAIMEMSIKGLGATIICREDQSLAGVLTDGDVRRALQVYENPLDMAVHQIMTSHPKHCDPDWLAARALATMESYRITVLPVLDQQRQVVGVIHFHDLITARIA